MVDVLYFSGHINGNGEVEFKRVEKHSDIDFPRRVDPIALVPNTASGTSTQQDIAVEPMNNDPTLSQFHRKRKIAIDCDYPVPGTSNKDTD